jgi:hypothetical protein
MTRSWRRWGSVACVLGLFTGSCGGSSGGSAASVTTVAQALKNPSEALIELQKSLDASVPQLLSQLPPKDRANLVNGMAWYDEDPRGLRAAHGVRGQVAHVSSRFLAYDPAPGLPATPSIERANLALSQGGVARALANAGPSDQLSVVRSHGLLGGAKRYIAQQRWNGTPVYHATLSMDLSATGRLTRFDAAIVPSVQPASGNLVSSAAALPFAVQHLTAKGAPWTLGPVTTLETEAVIVHRLEFGGPDDARHAWRFLMTVPGYASAFREVLVDRITKSVIASVDQVQYLNANDDIFRSSGRIGIDASTVGPILWRGNESCPGPTSGLTGGSVELRDLDEAKATLCEAENVFATFGPEFGTPNPRDWMEEGTEGMHVGIGAEPGLSVALNGFDVMLFAQGMARAEIVGHEIFHTTTGRFSLSSRDGGDAGETAAISEHLSDAFGTLLERRFPLRREDDCALDDDEDSMNVIATQDPTTIPLEFAFRPCSGAGIPQPWRFTCDPRRDNGGWCEGAMSYRNVAFNKYDAYGDTSTRTSSNIASHTNLGIGNRVVMSLLGEVSAGPFTVHGVGDTEVMRLVLGTTVALGTGTDWSSYAQTMIDVAAGLSGGVPMSALEQETRSALANAQIWSMPEPVMPRSASGMTSMPNPPPNTRPAVATVALTGDHAGRERTFVFYRPSATSTALEFAWRDDVAGGESSELSDGWMGPCSLPGAVTNGSPAAAGSDQSLFVAWGEPTSTPGESTLRGLRLTGEDATEVTSGCGFDWTNNDPLQERRMQGSPSIAVWGASENLTLCEVFAQDFPGLTFPFRTIGAMGIQIGDCVDIGERIPGMPHDLLPHFPDDIFEIFKGFDDSPGTWLPQPGDPMAAQIPDFDPDHAARIDLVSQLQGDKQTQDWFRKLPDPLGKRFGNAFDRYGTANAAGIEAIIQQKAAFGKDGFPEGTVQTVDLRFFDDILVVAFRDEDGNMRSTTWTDFTPTSDIALISDAPNTDPALTQARTLTVDEHGHRLEANFLYVVYGTSETVGGTARPRLSYRWATTFDPDIGGLRSDSFADEQSLDSTIETIGVRRKRDYRFIRTNQTPVVAGGNQELHAFVVTRNSTAEQPDDAAVGDLAATSNRIRHAVFRPNAAGKLFPVSERPVIVNRSALTTSFANAQAGAATATNARRRVRWFYPNGSSLGMRSVGER